MCGLFGRVTRLENENIRKLGNRMLSSLAHRGPDHSEIQLFNTHGCFVLFGHTRLSIIDLDPRSNQPMTSQSGRF